MYVFSFIAVIQGGNLAEMHQQIKTVIDSEQKKAIWVPVCSVWWSFDSVMEVILFLNQLKIIDVTEVTISLIMCKFL